MVLGPQSHDLMALPSCTISIMVHGAWYIVYSSQYSTGTHCYSTLPILPSTVFFQVLATLVQKVDEDNDQSDLLAVGHMHMHYTSLF